MKRNFTTLIPLFIKRYKLPPRPKFTKEMESECEESFLHGGRGPGGQKINKCNSKVQLKHIPTGIVVSCQSTRSRAQNRVIAREKIALEIERHRNGGGLTEREEAIKKLAIQNKRSKDRKNRQRHLEHKKANEEKIRQQQLEEQDIILSMLNDQNN